MGKCLISLEIDSKISKTNKRFQNKEEFKTYRKKRLNKHINNSKCLNKQ